MDERIVEAALAGLLHNIGLVAQRAQVAAERRTPGVGADALPAEATQTLAFIDSNVPTSLQAAARHGAYYQAPEQNPAADKRLSNLIALADLLSVGQLGAASGGTAPSQQVTIFDRISLTGQPQAANYLPLAPLTLNRTAIFPTTDILPQADARQRYAELNTALTSAARTPAADGAVYLENMLGALQRLTWSVPTTVHQGVADVSLYDHARTSAALAVCLADLEADAVKARLEAVRRHFADPTATADAALLSQPAALLVGGDISGVQDFIYTLSSKGAAKTLRGRSFYLQLMTEAVLRYVLQALGLPYVNVIYSGGGHFYLLAPASAAERLPDLRNYVSRTLLQHHGAALYLALASAPVPTTAFALGRFPEVWGQMHQALSRAKQQRYTELGDDLYTQVFEPQTHGGNREATCAVCGEEGRSLEPLGEPEDASAKICALCRSFQELGTQLPSKHYVALGLHAPQPTERGGALNLLRAFGVSVQLVAGPRAPLAFGASDRPQSAIIYALDDAEAWPPAGDMPTVRAVRYTLHRIPLLMDFNALQDRAKGIERLGVLRMDVDQLGELFSRGFGEGNASRATLARLAALSFQLSLFFEGWVKHLCEQQPDSIYAVYAGGDDVFLIGPWDQMPALAATIATDLAEFSGCNADVHLSGGLVFIHGKYPVYQAAQDAQDALDAAKTIHNALSFLGQAWKWSEFEQVTAKQTRLLKLVQGKEAAGLDGPQAILQVLRQLAEDEADKAKQLKLVTMAQAVSEGRLAEDEADKAKQLKGRPMWGPWMWHGAYHLTRMAERARKKKPELESALLAIRDELSADNYRETRQWGAAARWAQLWLREKQSEKQRS